MTLLALQPVAKAMRPEEIEHSAVVAKGYVEFFFENFEFMMVIALTFFFAGFIAGYYFKRICSTLPFNAAMEWCRKRLKSLIPKARTSPIQSS